MILTDQTLELGEELFYILSASDLSEIASYWTNSTSDFFIGSNGILTNATTLPPGTYWLEVKAYDPYGNYCNGFIKIVIDSPEEIAEITSPIIPGYNLIFLMSIILILSLIKVSKQVKRDE